MHSAYVLKKIAILIASLYLTVSLTFVLMKVIPGDPFMQEQAIPEEILKSLHRHYHLDDPLLSQYGRYLKGIVTCNLGPSFKYEGRTVGDIISEGFPVSFCLGLEAVCIAFFGGVLLGTISAVKRSKWQDQMAMVLAVIGISIPSFILATFLQYIFAMKLDLLPVARWGNFAQSILPAVSLASIPLAFIARLTRANMVEVLEQDYILTAKSKGLSTFQVVRKHVLKNSIMPVITYLGPLSATVLTGSFVIEKIFGIPGLGSWFVMSITNRDYTVIMGVTIFYSALLLCAVFGIDLLCSYLDPRIRFKEDRT